MSIHACWLTLLFVNNEIIDIDASLSIYGSLKLL